MEMVGPKINYYIIKRCRLQYLRRVYYLWTLTKYAVSAGYKSNHNLTQIRIFARFIQSHCLKKSRNLDLKSRVISQGGGDLESTWQFEFLPKIIEEAGRRQ